MKAIRVHRFGPPSVMQLEEVARPLPGPGEVLVKLEAAGVGPWDILVRTGKSELKQGLPLTPGSDIAGTVVDVHPTVSDLVTGDHVFGVTNPDFTGGYAEYALANANMLAPKPVHLSYIEAAAVPVIAVTAWQMLFAFANAQPGQTILITGAGGSVGGFALQLARLHRLHVIAAISSDDGDRIRRLGANDVIDLRQRSLSSLRERVDAVIDTAGGEKQREAAHTLKPGGILVSSVSPPDVALVKSLRVRGQFFIVSVSTQDLDRIARLLDEGQITAQVGTVLRLDEAGIAHEMMEGQRPYARGKIVLNINRKIS